MERKHKPCKNIARNNTNCIIGDNNIVVVSDALSGIDREILFQLNQLSIDNKLKALQNIIALINGQEKKKKTDGVYCN